MKKVLLFAGMMLCCSLLGAQEKIKEVVTDNYDRNSVSYIIVDRGDSFTSNINAFHNEMRISEVNVSFNQYCRLCSTISY